MTPRSLSVLVLGEDAGLARALDAALTRRGHRVTHATRPPQPGDAAPGVLIADLPAAADEVLAQVKSWHRSGPAPSVVWLSAAPGPVDYRRAARLASGAVLTKPVPMAELLGTVETLAAAPRWQARWRYASLPSPSVACSRDLLSFMTALGVGPAARARVAGAAAELLENASWHAYPDAPGAIEVAVELGPRSLWLSVEDQGRGFAPPAVPPAAGGLARAVKLCESLELESEPGAGARARARFDLLRVAFDGGPLLDLSDHDYLAPEEARELLETARRDPAGAAHVIPPALAAVVGRLLGGAAPGAWRGGGRCVSAGS